MGTSRHTQKQGSINQIIDYQYFTKTPPGHGVKNPQKKSTRQGKPPGKPPENPASPPASNFPRVVGQDCLLPFRGIDMGVDFRSHYAFMPQHLLHSTEVGPVFDKMGRKGMP